MTELVIATRGSQLALWQAEHTRATLLARDPDLSVRLLVLKTQGDKILDRALSEIGGKGLFTKEIEDALLERRADIAVHSMKDVPAAGPEGLVIAAVPERADPRDALLLGPRQQALLDGATVPQGDGDGRATALLRALPPGARVGTSSLRRLCQVLALRPDLDVQPLRGNVDTRLRKLHAGEYDAVVLATAGLARLGLAQHIAARFAPDEMVPACGQGALAIQCRADDAAVRARLAALGDVRAAAAVEAERSFNQRLGGSCRTPIGAHATVEVGAESGDPSRGLHLVGLVGASDGRTVLRGALSGALDSPAAVGTALAEQLLAQGADRLLGLPTGPA
ncbi:MAG: hydroxymethylbilane synthase [Polyangia bacterium]